MTIATACSQNIYDLYINTFTEGQCHEFSPLTGRASVTEYIVLTLRFIKFCKVLAVLDDLPATVTPVSRVTGDNDTGNLHISLTRDFRGVETELQLR